VLDLLVEFGQYLLQLAETYVLEIIFDHIQKLVIQLLLFDILTQDRVDGVPHVMRHGRID
jgi:hypothetical protein